MRFHQLLYLILIVSTGIIASFYGGNISYALFYMSLVIPMVSFLYTLYVYFRFKMYQKIGKKTVVKGELTEYIFQLANEDIISYQNIKVNFYQDKSKILCSDQVREYSLMPGERQVLETSICCNYRGEYYVGAQSVTITDFLYLCSITYPVFSKMKVTVLPRVLSLPNIIIISSSSDSKGKTKRWKDEEEELDFEVRNYVSGDNKKQINWKASAKKQELLVRKNISVPKTGVWLFMDLYNIQEDELTTIIVEDKIIESTLAIADYCKRKQISCKIHYDLGGNKTISIQNQFDFEILYEQCVDIRFAAEKNVDKIVAECLEEQGGILSKETNQYVIITHLITEGLYKTILEVMNEGYECRILFINEFLSPQAEHLLKLMIESGATVTIINHNDEIADVI